MKPIFKNSVAMDFVPVWETAGYLTIKNYKRATELYQILNIVEDVSTYDLSFLYADSITYKVVLYREAINTFGVRVNGEEPYYEVHLTKVTPNDATHMSNINLWKSDIVNLVEFYKKIVEWIKSVE